MNFSRQSLCLPSFKPFPAGLNVTSRWPDTSDFHSPISALVPRPKFMTPSWYYLFPVFTETNEWFSVLFVCITSARLHVERKRKIYRYFVNGTTQSRSCFWCQKKTSSSLRKFFTKIPYKWSRSFSRLTANHSRTKIRNKRFQLPLISTANQILWYCSNSQSALRPKSGRSEHKFVRLWIRPNFSGSN